MLSVYASICIPSPVCVSLSSQLPRKLPKRKSRFKRSDGSTSSDTTSSFIKRQVKNNNSPSHFFASFFLVHAYNIRQHHSRADYHTDCQWEGRAAVSMENVGHVVFSTEQVSLHCFVGIAVTPVFPRFKLSKGNRVPFLDSR